MSTSEGRAAFLPPGRALLGVASMEQVRGTERSVLLAALARGRLGRSLRLGGSRPSSSSGRDRGPPCPAPLLAVPSSSLVLAPGGPSKFI